jgi:prevent-host-death family protein
MVMKVASKIPHPSPREKTRTIPAGEFKAKCLRLMDEVAETGTTLIITKRGKPVAQVTAPAAPEKKPFLSLRGLNKGSMTYGDDLMEPLDFDWTWDEHNL